MTLNAGRSIDAQRDRSDSAAARRSTSLARRALRARSAFFVSATGQSAPISGGGDGDGIDADALATSFASEVLTASGPIALGAPCALGGVAIRAAGQVHGALFVADPAPRTFDAEDLALLDELGADLARELDRESLIASSQVLRPADGAPVPLDALVSLSEALVTESGGLAPSAYLEAADHLAGVAARLRELAASGTRAGRIDLSLAPSGRDGPAPQAGGATILLADDLDLNRKLISDMLTVEGYHVDCVADGAAAVLAVQAKSYDLVLMDMIMPGMDGIAATQAIRALPAPAGRVPIVALTANTFREQLDSCLEAGMDATLTKPMTFDALIDVVTAWTCGRTAAA